VINGGGVFAVLSAVDFLDVESGKFGGNRNME
jgi:hypothetical protein